MRYGKYKQGGETRELPGVRCIVDSRVVGGAMLNIDASEEGGKNTNAADFEHFDLVDYRSLKHSGCYELHCIGHNIRDDGQPMLLFETYYEVYKVGERQWM